MIQRDFFDSDGVAGEEAHVVQQRRFGWSFCGGFRVGGRYFRGFYLHAWIGGLFVVVCLFLAWLFVVAGFEAPEDRGNFNASLFAYKFADLQLDDIRETRSRFCGCALINTMGC
jgi:hypothetical protein